MPRTRGEAFETVAGDLLTELGYEASARGHDRRRLAAYRAKTGAWGAAWGLRPSARRSAAGDAGIPYRL